MVNTMPVVHIYVWAGISSDAKKRIIEGVTKTFTQLGIPAEAVEVLIHELPKGNWGVGGEQASQKFKHVKPP